MPNNTRLYLVRDKVDGTEHLVDATSRSTAVSTVTKDRYEVTIPSARETALLMAKGVTLTVSKEEEGEQNEPV